MALTFTMGTERYRTPAPAPTVTAEVHGGAGARGERPWVAEGMGARETDQRIAAILAVDEDILLLTSIVSQGDAGSFALRPAQRPRPLAPS